MLLVTLGTVQAQTKISIGKITGGIGLHIPSYIAMDRGFFKDEGLDARWVVLGGSAMIRAGLTGNLRALGLQGGDVTVQRAQADAQGRGQFGAADGAAMAAEKLGNGRWLPWADMERGFADADLIVQATSLGLGASAAPDWPVAQCRPGAIVVDIVYRPLETGLLLKARARGLAAVDGLGMLIQQGARAFELWFGLKPDVGAARARLMASLQR